MSVSRSRRSRNDSCVSGRSSAPDQAAFHEGFADVVALLSVLSIDSVVAKALDLDRPSDYKLIAAKKLTRAYLRDGVLFGLAQQVGGAMYGTHGVALRRSIQIKPNPDLINSDEFMEPHRRGELIVVCFLICGRNGSETSGL